VKLANIGPEGANTCASSGVPMGRCGRCEPVRNYSIRRTGDLKMKSTLGLKLLVLMLGAGALSAAQASDGDWKRGRIYYRQVCTSCHTAELKKAVGPNEKTQAEWAAYFKADKHGKETVKYYFSSQYRASIKAKNAAAAKYADLPEKDLMEDVKTFLLRSAKDGDAPAGCS
jgi:cytochrome c551/c552